MSGPGAANRRRRRLLQQLAALAGTSLLPLGSLRAAQAMRFSENPFTLGVASGYPTPNDVVLWTRLAPSPMAPGGGMPSEVVAVRMGGRVRRGSSATSPARVSHTRRRTGHTACTSSPAASRPAARTGTDSPPAERAVPSAGLQPRRRAVRRPERLRLAVASCQQYEHGYYTAYQAMVDDEPDLILHLGDYIYELSWGDRRIRQHGTPECHSLDDYRARYALYKSDPLLQAAHAACPWLLTWDDHEVENDYAADVSEEDDRARMVPRTPSGRLPGVLRAPAAAAARPAIRTLSAHAYPASVRRSRQCPDAR